MNNLFSIFDPQSWVSIPLSWISLGLFIWWTPKPTWVSSNRQSIASFLPMSFSNKELSSVKDNKAVPGFLALPLCLFTLIMFNNLLGLLPHVFTGTSHLSIALSMGLPLWMGHIIWACGKTPQNILAHLVPLGTPNPLMPFMVCIELISNTIRPLTLSVRLAANMIAGHLLLCLLSSQAPQSKFFITSAIFLSLLLLLTLETAVALIQSFVFTILSTLYLNEVSCPNL